MKYLIPLLLLVGCGSSGPEPPLSGLIVGGSIMKGLKARHMGSYSMQNLAIGGQSCTEVMNALFNEVPPDLVIVNCGHNDFYPEIIKHDLYRLSLWSAQHQTKVLLLNLSPIDIFPERQSDIIALNQWMIGLESNPLIKVLDFYSYAERFNDDPELFPDGLHMTPLAYAGVTNLIQPYTY